MGSDKNVPEEERPYLGFQKISLTTLYTESLFW